MVLLVAVDEAQEQWQCGTADQSVVSDLKQEAVGKKENDSGRRRRGFNSGAEGPTTAAGSVAESAATVSVWRKDCGGG